MAKKETEVIDVLDMKRPTIAYCKQVIRNERKSYEDLKQKSLEVVKANHAFTTSNSSLECKVRNLEQEVDRLRARNSDLGNKLGMAAMKKLYTNVVFIGLAALIGFVLGVLLDI